MEGRSLRPSEVLSTPLSTPELPTDCGDWLADLAPLSQACLGSPAGSPLKGGEREAALSTLPASPLLVYQITLRKSRTTSEKQFCHLRAASPSKHRTAKSNEPPQGGLTQSPNPSEVNLRESVCPGGRCYPPGPGPPCISRELRLCPPRTGCESLQGGPYKGLSHSDRGPLRALSPRSYKGGRGQSLVCPSPQPPNP